MAVTNHRISPSQEPPDDEQGKMTLFEHLAELRTRLIVAIVAVVVATSVAWFFYNDAVHFMTEPYRAFVAHHQGKDITRGNLVTNGPLEGFTTRLKVSAY